MTPEERQMLGGLFQRVNAAAATPRDSEAEAFINEAVRAAPHAPYVLAQTVLVQQHAMEAAANRISELEAAARQGGEQGPEQGSFLGNLGKTIFGGGPSAPPPRAPRLRLRVTLPRSPKAIRRLRQAIRPSRALGVSPSHRAAAASCRMPPRPRRASPAASRSATFWAVCSAATAAACSAAAQPTRASWAAVIRRR